MTKIITIQQFIDGTIDINTAIKKLNISERTIYRYKANFLYNGPSGLIHGLTGKPSNNQSFKMDKYKKFALKQKYKDFGPTLLAEELENELGWGDKINPESLRIAMIRWGIRTPKKRKIRKQKRDRREHEGELIQFDGSYHNWLEDGVERCILLAIDDATSKIKKMSFC